MPINELLTLVVHDTDRVHKVYHASKPEGLVRQVLYDVDKWDVRERIHGEAMYEDDDDEQNFPVTLDAILELYHDGDSEVGFTLFKTPLSEIPCLSFMNSLKIGDTE